MFLIVKGYFIENPATRKEIDAYFGKKKEGNWCLIDMYNSDSTRKKFRYNIVSYVKKLTNIRGLLEKNSSHFLKDENWELGEKRRQIPTCGPAILWVSCWKREGPFPIDSECLKWVRNLVHFLNELLDKI